MDKPTEPISLADRRAARVDEVGRTGQTANRLDLESAAQEAALRNKKQEEERKRKNEEIKRHYNLKKRT